MKKVIYQPLTKTAVRQVAAELMERPKGVSVAMVVRQLKQRQFWASNFTVAAWLEELSVEMQWHEEEYGGTPIYFRNAVVADWASVR